MCTNPQETADLVTFIEEILNGKLHFLCSETSSKLNKELDLLWSWYLYNLATLVVKKLVVVTRSKHATFL